MNSLVSNDWAALCAHVCSWAHNKNIVCVYWIMFTEPFRFISRKKRPECERPSAKPLRKLSRPQNSQWSPPPQPPQKNFGAWLISENVTPDAHWQPGIWSMNCPIVSKENWQTCRSTACAFISALSPGLASAEKASTQRFMLHPSINWPRKKSGKASQSSVVRLNTYEKIPLPVLVWGCCREPLLLLKCSVGLLRRQRPLSKRQVWIPTAAAAAQQISGITPASVGSWRLRQGRAGALAGVFRIRAVCQSHCHSPFFDTVVSISIVEPHWGFISFCQCCFCQSCTAKTYTPGSSGLKAQLAKLTVSSHTLTLPGLLQQLHNVNMDVLKV